MQTLYLLLEFLIDLHHGFYFHLRFYFHTFYRNFKLQLSLLGLIYSFLIGLSFSLELQQFLLDLNLGITPLIAQHAFILPYKLIGQDYLLFLSFLQYILLVYLIVSL